MTSSIIILTVLGAMMVLLIVFAFILVMGGVDSSKKEGGSGNTVVLNFHGPIEKEQIKEIAEIMRGTLCERLEYDENNDRQPDNQLIPDIQNTTPVPDGGITSEAISVLARVDALPEKERNEVLTELKKYGMDVNMDKAITRSDAVMSEDAMEAATAGRAPVPASAPEPDDIPSTDTPEGETFKDRVKRMDESGRLERTEEDVVADYGRNADIQPGTDFESESEPEPVKAPTPAPASEDGSKPAPRQRMRTRERAAEKKAEASKPAPVQASASAPAAEAEREPAPLPTAEDELMAATPVDPLADESGADLRPFEVY